MPTHAEEIAGSVHDVTDRSRSGIPTWTCSPKIVASEPPFAVPAPAAHSARHRKSSGLANVKSDELSCNNHKPFYEPGLNNAAQVCDVARAS